MDYFDYQSVAEEAGISEDGLQALCRVIREEFPHDEMMFELHMLRVCRAIRDRNITIEDALGIEQAKAA